MTKTIAAIMAAGGFKFKAMAFSGMDNPEIEAKLGGAVLGVHWSAKDDLMVVQFRINIGLTQKQVCLEPALTEETVDYMLATKRLMKILFL